EDYLNYRLKGTDRYYTGGLDCSFFYESKKKWFHTRLHHHKIKNTPVTFVSLRQITNTPSNIRIPGHVENDYPYASALFVTYGKLHIDTVRKFTVVSAISTGVIGPLALGEKIQRYFHKVVAYIQPEGWFSQLPNDFLLNYRFTVKKELLNLNHRLELIAIADINAGYNFNNCKVGFLLRAGNNLNYFSLHETAGFTTKKNAKGRFIFLIQPQLTVVGYNALLQGSLLNKGNKTQSSNVYTISSSSINRFIYGFSFGIMYETNFGGVSINQHLQTKEFRQVQGHEYGDIGLVYKFKNK
nr:lipid A deacylase LpxR family protein [Lacibacter sp.]